ncbi:hypothetical protein SAMN02927921_01385 [Sinomicrobium oceani]|uniref:Secreted protein n=1 Tax=Sinomicrobium oceani TaxID=1150368 RepID=A0A1K1NQN9_9FLAO|nr:hypothetical protein [Sinomicrobium oceani]SFW37639.1 hypothetical protein SAMN02927921_01385 [Sinomicrobium oceani]
MKRLFYLVVIAALSSLPLVSCTYNDTADNEAMQDTQGSGGEDEHVGPFEPSEGN